MPDETKRETTRTITLDDGVKFGDTTYGEIALKEPNGKQQSDFIKKAQTETGWDAGLHLVFFVSGVPLGALHLMPASKLAEAIEWVVNFTQPVRGPRVGSTE